MLNRIVNLVSGALSRKGKVKFLGKIGFYLLFFFPLLILLLVSYQATYKHMTKEILERKTATAYLSATIINERLDKLVDIAVSLASRPKLIEEINQGRWEQGIKYLKNAFSNFPSLVGIGLYDKHGIVEQGFPGFEKIIGKDMSYRDWYKGVSRNWQPYVSEVYRRFAEPSLNIVSVAVPIRNLLFDASTDREINSTREREVLGILILHVRLEVLSGWIKDLVLQPGELIYIFDKKGQIIYHPNLSLQGGIIDFSNVPAVRAALNSKSISAVIYDPRVKKDGVSIYRKIEKYNWGVIVNTPAEVLFAERDRSLRFIFIVYLVISGLTLAAAFLILQIVEERGRQEEEVRVLNRILTNRNAELESLNKELESFSYSVSHDLRAPLRAMDGFSLALLEDYWDKIDPKGRDYLQRVRDSSKHMAELIEDLLSLAKVSRSPINRKDIDLSRKVNDILARLREKDPGRPAEFEVSDGITANADNNLIELVLENLLGNAWKFTRAKEKARIEFGRKVEDGKDVYFVRDNGAGFDMAYVERLFSPFQRLHSSSEFEGSGIGLASVRRIISRHGGKVWAEAQLNKGAVIYFTLS
jgi:signal transduction histidine kinase